MFLKNYTMSAIYVDDDFLKLRSIATYAPSAVLICNNHHCTNNYSKNTTKYEPSANDGWLYQLSCSVCFSKWYICIECKKFKKKLSTTRNIGIHRNTYHRNRKRNICVEVNEENNCNKKEKITLINYDNIDKNDSNDSHILQSNDCNNASDISIVINHDSNDHDEFDLFDSKLETTNIVSLYNKDKVSRINHEIIILDMIKLTEC